MAMVLIQNNLPEYKFFILLKYTQGVYSLGILPKYSPFILPWVRDCCTHLGMIQIFGY